LINFKETANSAICQLSRLLTSCFYGVTIMFLQTNSIYEREV
jgi:hypothetical protein